MFEKNNLKSATVVVTGASSGIGRGTAIAFAKAGANLILAARNESSLKDVALECKKFGSRVLVIPTDITDYNQVRELAKKSADAFNNRIDVWVNDPGVGAVGIFENVPVESHTQVIATNLIGYMNGTHAALPYMKKQNSGVIINLNSLGSLVANPYAASYTASKFGLRGFSEAIRGELRNFPDIHMCDVFPGFVGSPGVQHGANYTGVELSPAPPYVSAQHVADEVVAIAKNPRATQMIGLPAHLANFFGPQTARIFSTIMAKIMEHNFHAGKPAKISDGNLFNPPDKNSETVEASYGAGLKILNVALTLGGVLILGSAVAKLFTTSINRPALRS
jgi:short-subunit dehydrogenase